MTGKSPRGGRGARLGEELKAGLAELVRERIKDPRLAAAGLCTVTHVRMSADLSLARVQVSWIGGDTQAKQAALSVLRRTAGYLRGELGRRLSLKHAPELRFELDDSAEHVAHIDRLLAEDPEPHD